MTCLNCGAELPTGAMFCGECGRATSARVTTAPRKPTAPVSALHPVAPVTPIIRTPIPPMQRDTPQRDSTQRDSTQRDTVALNRNWLSADFDDDPQLQPHEPARVATDVPPKPATPASPKPAPPALSAPPATPAVPKSPVEPVPVSAPPPTPDPTTAAEITMFAVAEQEDTERTRLVPRRGTGDRFVLQFSTGESITVFGTGLLGRNPQAQPGESFDQILAISDQGKSVSKTHLEFGQERGEFWISDRFSANGTVIREPESTPRRCDAGKRYRVVRGSRIDIGEQFVVVS